MRRNGKEREGKGSEESFRCSIALRVREGEQRENVAGRERGRTTSVVDIKGDVIGGCSRGAGYREEQFKRWGSMAIEEMKR